VEDDVIRVIERAYSLEGSEEAWLSGLAEAARPVLERGLGILAFTYRARPNAPLEVRAVAGSGISDGLLGTAVPFHRATPPEMVEATYLRRSGCASASEASGLGAELDRHPAWVGVLQPHGMHDYCAINVLADPRGFGCILGAPLPKVTRTAARLKDTWDRVAAHVAAGMRLRSELGTSDPSAGAEAIVSPSGQVDHAEGEAQTNDARETLRRAAVAVDRARGKLRREDPGAALELWQALVSGRWSLLEHFERDGRRYLVARRNDPGVTDPRALSARERQVAWYAALGHPNKLIGYELGLAPSTVATHLQGAMSKLGVGSRAELMSLVHALGHAEGAS
jgi:DNA-binding CsgD family transcriptional regulator